MLLVGLFPKSECKGIDFFDTLQIFSRLFFKNVSLLIYIKRKKRLQSLCDCLHNTREQQSQSKPEVQKHYGTAITA
jgi:hypothetical protein